MAADVGADASLPPQTPPHSSLADLRYSLVLVESGWVNQFKSDGNGLDDGFRVDETVRRWGPGCSGFRHCAEASCGGRSEGVREVVNRG